MRIALVNQDRGIGPGKEKGAAVHLAAVERALRAAGAEVVRLDEPDDVALESSLQAAADRGPLDLVYERLSIGKAAACWFARTRRIPFALEVNAPLLDEASRWRGYEESAGDRAAEQFVFSNADHVFAVSAPVAAYARSRGAKSIEICPNGVELEQFCPRVDDRVRDALAPSGRFIVGFHGRLRPWHGVDLLGRAVRLGLERGAPLHVVTVGRGEYAEVLGAHLSEDHRTHLEWVPHEEVATTVAAFDALPLCYEREVYFSPLKLAEGMAAGAVPVVPPAGDWMEFLKDGENALVYETGSPEGLADALERLARDPALRRRLGEGARGAARGLSWSRVAERVMSVAARRDSP